MKEGFKPDFGIYVKENLPFIHVIQFVNLEIQNILRIGPREYSLFTGYRYEGVEYAVSLDFPMEKLSEIFDLLKPHFSITEQEKMKQQLLDPTMNESIAEWEKPIGNICCTARLAKEEIINANERYIPFIVERFY